MVSLLIDLILGVTVDVFCYRCMYDRIGLGGAQKALKGI